MYLLGAIILGLVISYFFGGFNFSTGVCFFAAIVLIYPILLKLNFQDFKVFLKDRKLISLDLLLNFILLPLLAFSIAYLFFNNNDIYFIFSLILLAILPGGGLLLSWIHQSKANEKLGFLLLALNLFVFSLVYILFNFSLDYFNSKNDLEVSTTEQLTLNKPIVAGNSFLNFPQEQDTNQGGCIIKEIAKQTGLDCFGNKTSYIYGIYAFFILILLPLFLAILTKFLNFQNKIIKIIPYLTKIGSFLLIVYIFSLSEMKKLFSYNDFGFLIKIFLAVLIFYLFSMLFISLVLNLIKLDKSTTKALFWNAYVRFITLGFILSMLYIYNLSAPVEIIFIFIFAYFIQILSSTLYLKFSK